MREVVLEIRVRVDDDSSEETAVETSDRIADDITELLTEAGVSASITPKFVFEESSEVPVDLGN